MNEIIKKIYETSPYSKYKNKTNFTSIWPSVRDQGVYGELTQKGGNQIVENFKKYFNEDTIFYDLGSGLGKTVLHYGLQYGIKKSVGIEYSKERHQGAIDLLEEYAKDKTNIEFYCDKIENKDFSDATVVYADNTGYEVKTNLYIYNTIKPGCLFLYKKKFKPDTIIEKQERLKCIDRTYHQKDLYWFIKE